MLPNDYTPLAFPVTDAYERILYLNPTQSPVFTVQQGNYFQVQFEIPNILSIKLDEIWLKCNFTPGFTSTNGGDTFATVQPAFVPWVGQSSIERMWATIGGANAFNQYQTHLAANVQMNLMNNSITRNNMQYQYGSGQPQTGSVPQPQVCRWKPMVWDQTHLNSTGLLPVGKLPKVILYFQFTNPTNNMYYAGTPAGTVSLNYTVDSLQLQVVQVASKQWDETLKTIPLSWCSREWYYQLVPLGLSTTQTIQVPVPWKYIRGIVMVIRRVQDIQAIGPTSINKLVEYSPEVSNIVNLNVIINGLKRQMQDFQNIDWLSELKRLLPRSEYCDYFIDSKIGPTASSPNNTNVRTIYGLLLGQCYDTKTESGINGPALSSQISIVVQFTNSFTVANQADIFILHDRWIWISSNGTSTLDE